MKITILTPVYNDWKSASKLIEEINTIVKDLDAEFSLVIVNDASTEEKPTTISSTENLSSLEILNIKNNQGHGRCIATGLKHIFQNKEFDYVIPMDSDGEDRPEEIKSFLEYTAGSSSTTGIFANVPSPAGPLNHQRQVAASVRNLGYFARLVWPWSHQPISPGSICTSVRADDGIRKPETGRGPQSRSGRPWHARLAPRRGLVR